MSFLDHSAFIDEVNDLGIRITLFNFFHQIRSNLKRRNYFFLMNVIFLFILSIIGSLNKGDVAFSPRFPFSKEAESSNACWMRAMENIWG